MNHWGSQKPPYGVMPDYSHWAMKNCVGKWMLNADGGNRAYDLSGKGRDGILTNFSFPSVAFSGWYGNTGVIFDGIDDYILGTANALPTADSPRTISLRIKINTYGAIGDIPIFFFYGQHILNMGFSLGYERRAVAEQNKLFFTQHGNGCYSTNIVNINIWYYVVLVYCGFAVANPFRFYINGILDNATPLLAPAPLNTNLANLTIGSANASAGSFFNGILGDISFYNIALSDSQVKELYIQPYCMFPKRTYFDSGYRRLINYTRDKTLIGR